MKRGHDSREYEDLRERLFRLSDASLRINESLDHDSVLQDVVDTACALTEARDGGMTTLDHRGQLQDYVTHGLTAEQRWSGDLAQGIEIVKHFTQIMKPLRLGNLTEYLKETLGLTDGLPRYKTFLVAPVRHRDLHVGHFYVADKRDGGEFTFEDEETLVLFASQAALAISKARKHRNEQKAKADLEALIDTSPVGVAIFHANTGQPLSFNREATRILESLRTPGHSPEGVLQTVTVRRADGQAVSIGDLATSQAKSSGETPQAEEVVLQVPNGREVTVLVNATSIRSAENESESVVITLQDMTSLKEWERLRAGFLATVSHELHAPLTSIKGSITNLLDPGLNLNTNEASQFHRIIDTQTDRMRALVSDLLDVARIDTGTLSISPEPTDMGAMLDQARSVFELGGGKHQLVADLEPDLPWVMADRQRLVQVLNKLISNAARHSPEEAPVRVSIETGEFDMSVSVSDQRGGSPSDSPQNLFRRFSRPESRIGGDETGLDLVMCKGIVEAHGGRMWAESHGPGLGTRFTFTVPTADKAGFVASPPPSQRSTQGQVHILAVDHDPQSLRYVREALSASGYRPIVTGNPEEAQSLIEDRKPHLVLLDLMLPETNAIQLMQIIQSTYHIPVILLSAHDQAKRISEALDKGAADYVVKPFSPTELGARIRASLRRQAGPGNTQRYILEDLTIDYPQRLVTLGGTPVTLTAIEYRLIVELSVNAGRVLTYEHLLRRVWDTESHADVRPIRTVISSIRRKLGDDAENPTYIFTELRVGYKMPRGNEKSDKNP